MGRAGGRRLWLKVHLYLGLFAGCLLALLGLTGSVLVFSEEIDRALNPQLRLSSTADPRSGVNADEVYATVVKSTGLRPHVLELPLHPGDHFLAFARPPGESQSRAIIIDPATGAVLANRKQGSYFVSFSRKLHTELFMGDAGNWVVSAIGLLTLMSVITGIYLWWPRGGAWRRALSFHPSRRASVIHFELHRISGFYLATVVFVVTASGLFLATPAPFLSAIGAFADVSRYPERVPSSSPKAGAKSITLAEVERRVLSHVPGAMITGFFIPRDHGEAVAAFFRHPAEPSSEFGRSAIWVDRFSGQILYVRSYGEMSGADRFLTVQYLLHNGEIAGPTGEWLVFVSGLALPLLFVTGAYLWWVKRRPARH
jgi:uncharacterized iron-regulated membrane protein